MKKVIVGTLVLVFSLSLTASAQKSSLVGTWKSVSSKIITEGKTTEDEGGEAISIFTSTHHTFFAMSAGKKEFRAGFVARIEVNGNRFTETIEYTSLVEGIGKTFQYEYRIEGGKLYQTGTGRDGSKIESVWQRVK